MKNRAKIPMLALMAGAMYDYPDDPGLEGSGKVRGCHVEATRRRNQRKLPKGMKVYWFNKSGLYREQKSRYFTIRVAAINEKNAVRKFNRDHNTQ